MLTINTNNARTQTIEAAVEELSKRDSITMTDVREFLDIFTLRKVPNGKKAKYTDPNGEEHEYEVKVPINQVYSYKQDEKEIYTRVLKNVLENRTFFNELKDDVKLTDVLRWAQYNANFVEKDSVAKFVIWFLNTIVELKKACKTGKVDPAKVNGMHLEINSTTKGSGKTTFIHNLIEQAKKVQIPAKAEVELPLGGFDNTLEESSNLLVGYKERVYQKVDEATMMHIGRHEPYTYVEKGKMAISVPSNAITIGSTNGNPYAKDDRCFNVVKCIPTDYESRMEILQTSTNFLQTFENKETIEGVKVLNASTAKVCKFVDLFNLVTKESLKELKSNSDNKTKLQNYKIPGVDALQDVLLDLTTDLDLLNFVSVKGLYKLWEKQTGKHLEGTQKYMQFEKPIAEALNFLYSRKLVKGKGPSNDMKRQYDIFSILEDIKNYECSDEVRTIEDDVIEAWNEWERIIKLAEDFEDNNPDDNGPKIDFDKEINAHVSGDNRLFNSTFEYTNEKGENAIGFNKVENVNKGQEYVTVNEAIDSTKLSRKNEDMHGTNYLLEMDHIPKEEQKELIQKLPKEVKEAIHWICDSGNKSIHTVLVTDTDTNKTREREVVLNFLNKRYFKGHLDMSAKNAGRLGRNPNAIRRNGNKQTLYYYNNNPKPLYVHNLVEQERAKEEAERLERLYKMTDQKQEHSKFPLTVETLQARKASAGRDKAIEMLNGTCDWEGMVSACMYLLATGFERDEIENAVGYDDEWLPNALDTAEKRMH